jgi:hypothetical protein
MSSVSPLDLGRKVLADLGIEPGQGFRYSKLRSKAILIESETEGANQ